MKRTNPDAVPVSDTTDGLDVPRWKVVSILSKHDHAGTFDLSATHVDPDNAAF